MSKSTDASFECASVEDAGAAHDASLEGKPVRCSHALYSLGARGLSAMMYREASLRTSSFLGPRIACALKALLRGDYITAQERAALFKAASLQSADEYTGYPPTCARKAAWAGMLYAANSNERSPNSSYKIVPLHPHRSMDRADNQVLQKLGLSSDAPERTS